MKKKETKQAKEAATLIAGQYVQAIQGTWKDYENDDEGDLLGMITMCAHLQVQLAELIHLANPDDDA